MEKKSIVNVPFIAYEKEMGGKNKIITLMSIIMANMRTIDMGMVLMKKLKEV